MFFEKVWYIINVRRYRDAETVVSSIYLGKLSPFPEIIISLCCNYIIAYVFAICNNRLISVIIQISA
jgi:hypothetical protein